MTSKEEARAWAKQCADVTRGRMAESAAWDQIAERGQEWPVAYRANGKPYRGGAMMTPRQCFSNAARTVLGATAFDASGCQYAEGFARSAGTGLWIHHAWVVSAYGLVIERTWKVPGSRYVGVTIDGDQMTRPAGMCQLAKWPLDMAWAPDLVENPEAAALLFAAWSAPERDSA